MDVNNREKVPEPGGPSHGTVAAEAREVGGGAEETAPTPTSGTPNVPAAAAAAPVKNEGKVGGGGIGPPAEPLGPIEVSLEEGGSLAAYKLEEKPVPLRDKGAMWVAQAIVAFFGISLILVISLGFKLLFAMIDSPQNAKELIGASLIPFLEKVATFYATVFSPLLAFILGYYFGEKQTQRS